MTGTKTRKTAAKGRTPEQKRAEMEALHQQLAEASTRFAAPTSGPPTSRSARRSTTTACPTCS